MHHPISSKPKFYAPYPPYELYQINLCTLPGSLSHSKGLVTKTHSPTKLTTSNHINSNTPLQRLFSTTPGPKCSLQKKYGSTKYRNSNNGLGMIVSAVHPTIPRRKRADCVYAREERTAKELV